MKRFSLYLIAASAAMILFTTMAAAQPRQRMMMHRGDGERMGMRWSEELKLTDEQKDQIRQIFLDTRKKNIDLEAKLKLGRIELHELMTADTPDQKKIDAQISALSQLHEAKMRVRIESLLAIQKLLTPEQRKKAKELRLFERFHERRQFGFGGGPRMGMGMGMPQPDDRF